MGSIRTFRDLVAWRKAMALAKEVYRASERMPKAERFGLISQMRRSAVSVPSNIAEGYARQRTADYLRFLRIARGSLAELGTQLELAAMLELMPEDEDVTLKLQEVDRVLQGLIRGVERTQVQSP